MTLSLSRRSFAAGSLAAFIAGSGVRAQDTGGLDDAEMATLDVVVTSTGFGGVPEEIEAGRYLVTVTLEDGVQRGGVGFVRPPDGLTGEQFVLELQSASEVVPQDAEAATPEAISGWPPSGAPVVAYDATFAGGVMVAEGESGRVVLDLDEGEWVVWGGAPLAPQAPLITNVTGGSGDAPEPDADVEVTMSAGSVGIDETLPAGDHVLRIAHDGGELHALELLRGPDGMSDEELPVALRARLGGADEDLETLSFDPVDDLQTVFSMAPQSEGTVQWIQVSLEPGTYAAICTFPMMENAAPHALHDEYAIFTVE